LERAFQDSQDKLAELVPDARHVIADSSGHYIQLDQPALVISEIHRLVSAARHHDRSASALPALRWPRHHPLE
jgi:pimeloyl-ACP methyl ester carboxylesterase